MIDGLSYNLGMYDTIEEAKQARMTKVNDAFGQFANSIEQPDV
jgi:hypothetical protein